jgi:hypothetical protein
VGCSLPVPSAYSVIVILRVSNNALVISFYYNGHNLFSMRRALRR